MPYSPRRTSGPLMGLALLASLALVLPAQAGKLDAGDGRAPAGTTLAPDATTQAADIDFGDDSSRWANDEQCDDPRFSGEGMAPILERADLWSDASDCQAAFAAGTITYIGEEPELPPVEFDYGDDWSEWANDGECDDPRFTGPGTDKKMLDDDMYGDASDCRALEAEGKVSIITVYTPEYAAGAPYDSSHIDFGDNESDYADDDYCDDPRFMGPGAATVLLESDLMHDAEDCRAAYEDGTIMLIEE
ncbi:hypothetical protein [Devosia sp.]|uniref:hypothetical protein n=1 Tax=Devosia sp. TaxID=1871048 RepID=UPI002AFFD9F9|nr:hypothetical protein [Devosia sp.]